MDAHEKLRLLADESRYDISCACGRKNNREDHRRRGPGGLWLYPASVPRGGTSVLLKTLLSSACTNDCRYCHLRAGQDVRRCTLDPSEVARLFMNYYEQGKVFGLFLSSGVLRSPDYTMDRLLGAALRSMHPPGAPLLSHAGMAAFAAGTCTPSLSASLDAGGQGSHVTGRGMTVPSGRRIPSPPGISTNLSL